MLTADLVQTRRRGDRLFVKKLGERTRRRAAFLAERYLLVAEQCVGLPREVFDERIASIGVEPQERKLADGLVKLVRDRCLFEMAATVDPIALRREVFELASSLRGDAGMDDLFHRDTVLDQVASARDMTRDEIEAEMYADLKNAHRLLEFQSIDAGALVEWYDKSQHQAVLLKAVRLRLVVRSEHPAGYRNLFHKLKFLRLLHVITPVEDGCYQIDIDGPYALFRSVTKYGLQLALLLPVLKELDSWRLEAEVVWGREKRHLTYRLEDKKPRDTAGQKKPLRLPDEIRRFVSRFEKRDGAWDVEPSAEILELKGLGLCVPDLVFTNRDTGEQVFFEVMGFWSREAVWRRVELVERGLPYRIIFAVSSRLRVSQEVLGEDLPGSLYVYKGVMDARRVAEMLDKKVVI